MYAYHYYFNVLQIYSEIATFNAATCIKGVYAPGHCKDEVKVDIMQLHKSVCGACILCS